MGGQRTERVADLIQKEVAYIIQRKVRDPRLVGITITAVRMSRDLKRATVFYCDTLGRHERSDIDAAFAKARTFIRRELAERVYLRYLPDLSFVYDDSFDYGEKIDLLLRKIHGNG
ncbi:30S ribosome-binding factor RbfA [Thermodesulforhabdus norvegica]|uniref:Ribosome-binding factor A n=1 Tax=Thermodesulforhabdus norvegica TaxID=39841 RepID=A0A1I4VM79_9BACT|nr:30S ribosome-binding factor RbfA [Thermodesulforhabdus norvegica]SFN02086.1 ribosome-binding factor A [Thermodesulforhabdus norvegica]